MSEEIANQQQVWKPAAAAQSVASRMKTIAQLQAYIDEVSDKYKDDAEFVAELARLRDEQ